MTRDNRDSPVKWRRIEAALRAHLTTLPANARVTAIDAAAARHHASRQTAAKAYRRLAAEGLLVFHPGLGYYTPPRREAETTIPAAPPPARTDQP